GLWSGPARLRLPQRGAGRLHRRGGRHRAWSRLQLRGDHAVRPQHLPNFAVGAASWTALGRGSTDLCAQTRLVSDDIAVGRSDLNMCGIVGYIGQSSASEIIVNGLRRLEYRGYDSAGLVVLDEGRLGIRRRPGKIDELEALLASAPLSGRVGLGHTRWATHGPPSESNAHPHLDCSGSVAVVHNGIIENYLPLRQRLLQAGHEFRSQTDTEVIAHLLEDHLADGRDLMEAV